MARTVILSVADGDWNVWGQRFVKRQPLQRLQQTITPGASAATAKTAVLKAARTAGADGVLIISVGHGGGVAGNPTEGVFELAPGGALNHRWRADSEPLRRCLLRYTQESGAAVRP